MFSQLIRSLPLCAAGLLVLPADALAHAVCGERVFPATLGIDDPGINDELTILDPHLPAFELRRCAGVRCGRVQLVQDHYSQCRHSDFGRSDLRCIRADPDGPP